jgi:hypothetical protein
MCIIGRELLEANMSIIGSGMAGLFSITLE